MKKSATRKIFQAGSVVLGVAIAIACQHTSAQSVPSGTPTGNPKKAAFIQSQLASAESQLATVDAKISDARRSQDALQTRIATLKSYAAKMSISKESYPEVLKTLHAQRVQLSIDLAGIEARHQAIQAAIAKLVQQRTDNDLKPLQEIIIKQEAYLSKLRSMAAAGTGTNDFHQVEIALLESKSRLAQMKSPQGGLLAHLNQHLLDTTLERAEKFARLEKANQLIEDTDEYRSNFSQTQKASFEMVQSGRILNDSNHERTRIVENIKLLRFELSQLDVDKD